MVRSTIAPFLGNFTWQVSLVPWSWGRGVRVSTDEKGVLGPRELGAEDVQEKMGGMTHLQAQGTEQFRFPGRPASRAPGLRTWGWRVRAGERRGRQGSGGSFEVWPPEKLQAAVQPLPLSPHLLYPQRLPRGAPTPALPWDPHDPHCGLS